MENLFSHVSDKANQSPPQRKGSHFTTAIFLSLPLSLEETWLAFTEYTHLWWPHNLKRETESYIEFGEKVLLEEDENGEQFTLGETVHFSPQDVIAVSIHPDELKNVFSTGLSIVFDEEEDATIAKPCTTVEISSGLVSPRDLGDSPIGVIDEDKETAETLLKGFARFMKAEVFMEKF